MPALSSHGTDGPSTEHRLSYFKQEWSPVELSAVEQISIAWKDEATTAAALADVRAVLARKYAAAVRRLSERGWLTDEEARALAQPVIRGVVRDLRSQQ